MNRKKLLQKLTQGSVQNIRFGDMEGLAVGFGFRRIRINGSHHIYCHPGIPELLNLQEVSGQAKPYQIRQFLRLVERYNLQLEDPS